MERFLPRILNPYTPISILSINPNLPRFPNCLSTAAEEEDKAAATITAICKSSPKNLNWETLSQKLNSTNLTNSSIINKVLIQLNHPPNAKKALSFFHWSSHFTKSTHQIHTYALLIHILVRAKLIKDATALIESVLTKSGSPLLSFVHSLINSYEVTNSTPFVFDLLVQISSKLQLINEAIDVCFCLCEHGFKLSVISYNTLLHVIQRSDKTKLVWKVYEHMIENGTYPNDMSVRIMISALCKEGNLQKIVGMIDRIHGKRCLPRVIVNSYLVYEMIEDGRIEEGLVLLKRMLIRSMIIDTVSYSLIVYGKIKMGDLECAYKVFDEMLQRGFQPNSFVRTSFILAYCEAGKVDDGDKLFQDMGVLGLEPYDETYMHMIVGCSRMGRLEESLKLCEEMSEKGFVPSCSVFNHMIEGLNGHGFMRRADEILTRLLDIGFVPDASTYSHLMAGYGRLGDIEAVLKLYYEMEYRNLSPEWSVFSWLIVSLCQAGRLAEAEKVLNRMKARSLIPSKFAYDALISCLLVKGEHAKAQHFQAQMVG